MFYVNDADGFFYGSYTTEDEAVGIARMLGGYVYIREIVFSAREVDYALV